jgi:hypothetical protein
VVDVVAVDDVRTPRVERGTESVLRLARPDHPRREADPVPGGLRCRLELDVGGQWAEDVLGVVLRVGHPPDPDVVALVALARGDVEHVALGAAPAVEELVDMEDPHQIGRPAGSEVSSGSSSAGADSRERRTATASPATA